MKHFLSLWLLLSISVFAIAQREAAPLSTTPQAVVPRLIRFSGTVKDATGTVGVTFTLHKSQEDQNALWIETQNVQLDSAGKYTVLLGATKASGVPMDLFTSGEAQWLEVRVEGKQEQPRVLLVSVPYALKAAEAETLAGHAATEFVTTDKLHSAVQQQLREGSNTSATEKKNGASPLAPTNPATNFVDNTTNQVVSVTQNGSGAGIVSNATTGYAIRGNSAGTAIFANSTGAGNAALQGSSSSTTGKGVYGYATSTTGINYGVLGSTTSPQGIGIYGYNNATTGNPIGILGATLATGGIAIQAQANAASGASTGILSRVASASGTSLVLQNTAGGSLISAQSGASNTPVFAVDGGGNVQASGALTIDTSSTFVPLVARSTSPFGSRISLINASVGGREWDFISAGQSNTVGAGNLSITNSNGGRVLFDGPITTSSLQVNGLARSETGLSLGGNATLSVDAPFIPGGQFVIANGTMSINQDVPVSSNSRMTFTGYLFGDTGDGALFSSLLGMFRPDRDIVVTGMYGIVNARGVGQCANSSTILLSQPGNPAVPFAQLVLTEGQSSFRNAPLSVTFSHLYDVTMTLQQNSSGCGAFQHTTQNPVVTVEYYMK